MKFSGRSFRIAGLVRRWSFAAFGVLGFSAALAGMVNVAYADPDGEQVFKRYCSLCHSIEAGKNRVGPSLAGVVGRKSGTVDGYLYSAANKAAAITWDADALDKYLTDPKAFLPGNKMPFAGLKDPAERQAVITYLKAH